MAKSDMTIAGQAEKKPVYSKSTGKLLCRVSEDGVYVWDKLSKAWELFTWAELRAVVETQESKQKIEVR